MGSLLAKPVELWTWEVHKGGKVVKQYSRLGVERPIAEVLRPVEGLPHHFQITDDLEAFILVDRQGQKIGIDFTRRQFVLGMKAAPFSYKPDFFFNFRRVAHSFMDNPSKSMEFHFGIMSQNQEPQEMVIR